MPPPLTYDVFNYKPTKVVCTVELDSKCSHHKRQVYKLSTKQHVFLVAIIVYIYISQPNIVYGMCICVRVDLRARRNIGPDSAL